MFNLFDIGIKNPLDEFSVGHSVSIRCIAKRSLYYKEDTGFGAFIMEDVNEEEFKISGLFVAPPIYGQTYLVKGKISEYKGEKQIRIESALHAKPLNKKGIIEYLKTLKGLKSRAELIYDVFGEDSIEILMKDPMKVAKTIKGIGKKSVKDWAKQLDRLSESQEAVATLLGYGISVREAVKLYKVYGDNVVSKIEQNPYFLSKEVEGYGFEKCDRIARQIGISPRDENRLKEGIIHTLVKASTAGHCYLPVERLIKNTTELLEIKLTQLEMARLVKEYQGCEEFKYLIGKREYSFPYKDLLDFYTKFKAEGNKDRRESYRFKIVEFDEEDGEIEDAEMSLISEKRIISPKNKHMYLPTLFYDELCVAERLKALAIYTPKFSRTQVEDVLNQFLKEKNIELEEEQRLACIEFCLCPDGVYILDGSAGTGKTFTLKIILTVIKRLEKLNTKDIVVLAPTGRASKVASKSTGMDCKTIHRGLGFVPGQGFQYNESNPFEAKVIICDETSMLDITLARYLFTAIANGAKVIFMGDIKQLPSIGAGNVLKDMIESNKLKVVTLKVPKRQGLLSGVIRNAYNIIEGKTIKTYEDTKDAYFLKRDSSEAIQLTIIECIHRMLKFNGYSLDDIQVLSPMRKGSLGTNYLNYLIQKEFNPDNNEIKILANKFGVRTKDNYYNEEVIELYFKKGDKVIHTKNNYDIEWYDKDGNNEYVLNMTTMGITNGECGVIEDIEIKKAVTGETSYTMIVKYEGGYVKYTSFREIEHAYALTIHKSQGSSWKAIIMPMSFAFKKMLSRNIFYTGWTRAEEFGCVIGDIRAVNYAIQNVEVSKRYTGLKEAI